MKFNLPTALALTMAFGSTSVSANTIDNLVADFVQKIEQNNCSADLTDLETSQAISQSLGVRVHPTLHLMKDYLIEQGTLEYKDRGGEVIAKTAACGGEKVVPVPTESLKNALEESGKCSLSKQDFRSLLKASNIGGWEGSGALKALSKKGDVVYDKKTDNMNIKFGKCS
ncbi:hypothetical protein [Vibrio nigripulchritudo]|uniref:hypothetical protein n=1 Tax=Vibrio nigripulchritudo TaxID=28173 RepID=UPI0005FA25A9|nr:hypothetical protein [Vibrio nigripulchritudo]KJY73652.1 hypothetical protein TW74_20145 [Vibrio nigripulchritudo]